MKPTIHLTNHASRRLHGPGRRLTIMAAPRQWEHGDGRVPALVPYVEWVREAKAGFLPMDVYRLRYVAMLDREVARGVDLLAELFTTADGGSLVRDGDTLCCACSRAEAAAGRCHRVWAAAALVRAGWRVLLDGVEVTP